MSQGRQGPPCLWQEQQKGEEDDTSGLEHRLADPVQPLSFTTKCSPLEQQRSGLRAQGSILGRRVKGRQLVCFNPSTGVSQGLSIYLESRCTRVGWETRREKIWQGQERGKAIMVYNSVLYFKPVAESFSPFTSKMLLTLLTTYREEGAT